LLDKRQSKNVETHLREIPNKTVSFASKAASFYFGFIWLSDWK